MTRDVDLVRRLLMAIEAHGIDCPPLFAPNGRSHDDCVRYHLRLLVDAGFVEETPDASNGHVRLLLTERGHELLELVRRDDVWEEAKRVVRVETGGLSITALRAVLSEWARTFCVPTQVFHSVPTPVSNPCHP